MSTLFLRLPFCLSFSSGNLLFRSSAIETKPARALCT